MIQFHILVSLSIILGISGLFAPFVIITIAQDAFYQQTSDMWLFQAPTSSYIVGGAAFVYAGLIFGILAYYQSRQEGKKLFKILLTIVAVVPGAIMIYLTTDQYYYFTDEGIYQNSLFRVEEDFYPWEDIVKAHAVSEINGNQASLSRLELTTLTGEIIAFRYSRELIQNQRNVRSALDDQGVELTHKLEGEEQK